MSEYVKFDCDAEVQLQEAPLATSATAATPQEKSSESSISSMEVPPLSRYCTPQEMVQGMADVERGDQYDGDRSLATFATPATQEGQSSGSSESSRNSNLSLLDTRSTTPTLCQHARTGRRKESSNEGKPQLIPVIPSISHWPNSYSACYTCGMTRRWRSIYGAVVCARCHPPPDAALVVAWEGEA